MEIIKLRDEYIKLGQALKAANLVEDGVEAKLVIQDGLVKVNNEVDIRRGRKLYDGDVVSFDGRTIEKKILNSLAPSIFADSKRDSGIALKFAL